MNDSKILKFHNVRPHIWGCSRFWITYLFLPDLMREVIRKMKDDEQEEKVWEMMSEKWKWREAAQKQINSVQRKKLHLDHKTGCMMYLAKIVYLSVSITSLDFSCLSLLKDQFSNLFELLRPPSPGIYRSKDLLFLLEPLCPFCINQAFVAQCGNLKMCLPPRIHILDFMKLQFCP